MGNNEEELPKKRVKDEIIAEEIEKALEKARELKPIAMTCSVGEEIFEAARRKTRLFNDYNRTFLEAFFSNKRYLRMYVQRGSGETFTDKSLPEKSEILVSIIENRTEVLESILSQLNLLAYEPSSEQEETSTEPKDPKKVFVVHGQDEGLRNEVELYLHKIDLNPIILKDLPCQGRTLIEKFEDHSDVSFAVVLLTPDDLSISERDLQELKNSGSGQINLESELKGSPRPNVLFELGFFVCKLERDNVCVIYVPGTDILSDYSGVEYIPIDHPSGWRNRLAQELLVAGLDYDQEKALS